MYFLYILSLLYVLQIMDGYAKDQDLSYDPKYNNLDSGTVSLLKKKGTSLFINDLQNETTIEDLTVSSVDVLSYYLMENDSEMAKLDFQDSYANYLRALNINQEGDYAYRVAGASMLSNYIQNSFNETKESDNSNMNNWISRTELELRYNDSDQLEYSILTVQPLRQTVDKKHTLFSQFSLTQAIDEVTKANFRKLGMVESNVSVDPSIVGYTEGGLGLAGGLEWQERVRREELGVQEVSV